MIEPTQVHQFMDQDVVANGWRHEHQTPVQGNMAIASTRSPARALIADADTRDRHPVLGRDLVQPRWQLLARALAQRAPVLERDR